MAEFVYNKKQWAKMKRTLLYIVKTKDSHNILGIFSSLQKAYEAGHEHLLDKPKYNLELRIVQQDMSHFLGCSGFELDFEQNYSEDDIREFQSLINNWSTWEHFDYIQEEIRKSRNIVSLP